MFKYDNKEKLVRIDLSKREISIGKINNNRY